MSEQSNKAFGCLVCCAARHASWESGFNRFVREKRRRRRQRQRGIGGGGRAQKNIISHPGEARAQQRAESAATGQREAEGGSRLVWGAGRDEESAGAGFSGLIAIIGH